MTAKKTAKRAPKQRHLTNGGPRCSVCTHPDRSSIDAQLLAGRSVRDVKETFDDVSKSALERHRAAHLRREPVPPPVARVTPAPVTIDGYLGLADRLYISIDARLTAIESSSDLTEVDKARGLSPLTLSLQRLRTLIDEPLSEKEVVRLRSFKRLVDAIKRALEPYPEAMTAVATALQRAAGGEAPEPRGQPPAPPVPPVEASPSEAEAP